VKQPPPPGEPIIRKYVASSSISAAAYVINDIFTEARYSDIHVSHIIRWHNRMHTVQLLIACYFQQWWTRYSSRIAIFIHRLQWMLLLILIVLSRLDRGIQSVMPWKMGKVLNRFNCTDSFVIYASCWRTFTVWFACSRLNWLHISVAELMLNIAHRIVYNTWLGSGASQLSQLSDRVT